MPFKCLLAAIATVLTLGAGAQIIIPRSIDGTGKTDVTKELNSFISSVPDSSILIFPSNKTYRVEGILRITEQHVPVTDDDLSVKRRLPTLERELIARALERTKGNRTRAAEMLELSTRALSNKIQEYGLS